MRKDIQRLVNVIQDRVVGILIVQGYVELIDKNGPYKFSNIELTNQGSNVVKVENVTDEQINSYRKLWPEGYRASPSSIRPKLTRFLTEHSCTMSQIENAARKWLEDKETPYHGKADYFFYKEEKGGEISRCEEYLELGKDKEHDYREEYT